jgi:hypothetical protein
MFSWFKALLRKIELSRFKVIDTYRGYMVIEKLFFINRGYKKKFDTEAEAEAWIKKWGNT